MTTHTRRLAGIGRVLTVVAVAAATAAWWGGRALAAEFSGQPETILLREGTGPEDRAWHVRIEMTAEGNLLPARAPGQPADSPEPKPLPMKVQSRYDFLEREMAGPGVGVEPRSVRYVRQAAVAISGEVRPLTTILRPEVSTLIARRDRDGLPLVVSSGGPLTRQELDIVQGAADPLVWREFFPSQAVAVGETWALPTTLARSVSDYESLATNTLRAKLEALDEKTATVRLGGEVRGATRGGEGVMRVEGTIRYDRLAGRIEELTLERDETRRPGHVEAGFQFKGVLTARRTPTAIPPELADAILAALPTTLDPSMERLRFQPPNGPYVLYHDRHWHLFWEDARMAVLKRLDNGEMVAQCNLAIGPDAGVGKHQDPAQFREDIKAALGKRFVRFAGAGEISEPGSSHFIYQVVAQGLEGDQNILWVYYLLASPAGKQVLATFTLNLADKERLGNGDLDLIGSLDWVSQSSGSAP